VQEEGMGMEEEFVLKSLTISILVYGSPREEFIPTKGLR